MKPTVKLTSYNMGDDATEQDFEFFVEFVTENIERLAGFRVDVDSYGFVGGPARDTVADATDEQEEAIREALRSLWEEFCGGGWDAAYKAAGITTTTGALASDTDSRGAR